LRAFTRQSAPGDLYVSALSAVAAPTFLVPVLTTQAVTGDGFNNGNNCTAIGISFSCSDGPGAAGYVPIANSMPGALTSRPDRVVSSYTDGINTIFVTDFGCGDDVYGVGAACVEGPPSTGINTMDRIFSGANNTAPGANGCGVGTCVEGVLTGALHSVVTLEGSLDPEMPSGSIVFDWTPGPPVSVGTSTFQAPTNGQATFTQDINQTIIGLYTFNEHDTTVNPFHTYGVKTFGGVADAGETTGSNFAELYPAMEEINVSTALDLQQETLGGEGAFLENIENTLTWGGAASHVPGGAYFTPGLNIRDWNGNSVDPAPGQNPPGDGAGFPN
jgi:hypothetical protein